MWNTTTVPTALAHHWASHGVAGCFSLHRGDHSLSSVTVCVSHQTVHLHFNPAVSVSSWHPWSTLFHLPFSAPCSWMGESIARALAAASTGYGKELSWPPLTLPVLLWLMLLPQQEKSKGLEGGAMETAPLSHARKKALTSSPWWVAPADYHRGTVGSSPFHTGAAICPIPQ